MQSCCRALSICFLSYTIPTSKLNGKLISQEFQFTATFIIIFKTWIKCKSKLTRLEVTFLSWPNLFTCPHYIHLCEVILLARVNVVINRDLILRNFPAATHSRLRSWISHIFFFFTIFFSSHFFFSRNFFFSTIQTSISLSGSLHFQQKCECTSLNFTRQEK